MIIVIIIYYIFHLLKKFISIISFASGWGLFSGVSGKSNPGWSEDPGGLKKAARKIMFEATFMINAYIGFKMCAMPHHFAYNY